MDIRQIVQVDQLFCVSTTAVVKNFIVVNSEVINEMQSLFVLFSVALQPPIVPRIRHTGDTRNFFEYPEQNWQSWYEKAGDTVKQQVL